MDTQPKAGRFARLLLAAEPEALAKATSCSLYSVYAWRRGALPARSRLEAIAAALGKPLDIVQAAYAADKGRRRASRARQRLAAV